MLKRIVSFSSALVLSLSSLFVLTGSKVSAAAVAWTNSGTTSLNTAGNWNPSSAVPGASDTVTFTTDGSDHDLTNSGSLSFTAMTFAGTGTGNYTISGGSIALSGDITDSATNTVGSATSIASDIAFSAATHTINVAGGSTLYLDGVVSGSGAAITKTGSGTLVLSGNNTFTGLVTVSAGKLQVTSATGLGTTAAATTVSPGADIDFESCTGNMTVHEALTLSGASSSPTGDLPTPKLMSSASGCTEENSGFTTFTDEVYGQGANNSFNTTFDGNITINAANATVAGYSKMTFTGAIDGTDTYGLVAVPGYSGQLVITSSGNTSATPNGTYAPTVFTKTLSDSQPSSTVGISTGSTITITGTRSDVVVNGGTLKGTGTVGEISLSSGVVAPGMSPGVLNTGDLTFTGGTHQEEIGGTAAGQFDQLNVTGTVTLGSATTLSASLVNGFTPKGGDSFVIINNDLSDVVSGTFVGLPEGATFTVGSTVFKISYAGGSNNNDVVLTAQATPATPNTGAHLLTSNPLVTLASALFAAGGLVLVSRRYRKLATKRS